MKKRLLTKSPGYEKKFQEFIKAVATAKANNVGNMIIKQPGEIGDTYEEVMESLSRLAEAGVALHIVQPVADE